MIYFKNVFDYRMCGGRLRLRYSFLTIIVAKKIPIMEDIFNKKEQILFC